MNDEPHRWKPGNISDDTWAATCAVIGWGRGRWPTARIITELAFKNRRIDVLFVQTNDIVGVEVKGKRDTLNGDRLTEQLREYNYYLPEVWLAVDQRWQAHTNYLRCGVNQLLVCENGECAEQPPRRMPGVRTGRVADERPLPIRDEMCCSRLLELLWNGECLRIGQRTQVITGPVHKQVEAKTVRKLLARMLTGNEIIREVCTELRARPEGMVGMGSDKPIRGESNGGVKAAARAG